jgi:hypothetical protein
MDTLALDSNWDLQIINGTLAIRTGAIAIAQDVACAVRTFQGEVWYNWAQGVPYYQQILGYRVSLQFMKSKFIANGMLTPGVGSIVAYLTGPDRVSRNVGGQLQIYSTTGQLIALAQTDNLFSQWWVQSVSYGASGADT